MDAIPHADLEPHDNADAEPYPDADVGSHGNADLEPFPDANADSGFDILNSGMTIKW